MDHDSKIFLTEREKIMVAYTYHPICIHIRTLRKKVKNLDLVEFLLFCLGEIMYLYRWYAGRVDHRSPNFQENVKTAFQIICPAAQVTFEIQHDTWIYDGNMALSIRHGMSLTSTSFQIFAPSIKAFWTIRIFVVYI